MDGFEGSAVDLQPLDGGWSGETFVATTAGERVVVRLFADPRHHPRAAEIQEALLRLVRGLLPVPQVLEVRPADPVAGTPGLLVTELVGGVRGDLLLPTLDDAGLREVGRNLGLVARTLSRIPMLRTGTFEDGDLRIAPYDLWLPAWVGDHAERLRFAAGDLDRLRAVAEDAAELLGGWHRACLVHSDLNPKNVLLDAETLAVTAVLDWEFSHAGHPLTDLGNLLRFDRHPAYVAGVLEGFGEGQDVVHAARAADLVALVELATRRHDNPVAARAFDHLLAIARSADLSALPDPSN